MALREPEERASGREGDIEAELERREQALLEELARRSLLHFTEYTKPDYQTNWHHRVICEALEVWNDPASDLTRLMIFTPPQRGKSELVSRRLPAYIFGRDPAAQVITASYTSDLARAMNRDCQRIIDDEPYQRLFPRTKLYGANVRTVAGGTYLRNSDEFEIVGTGGYYKSAGVGGGLTGRGFTRGIIDDPVKDRKEADSVAFREMLWDWYTNVFYTRQRKNARILLTMTRWHEDDLAGRLLRAAGDGGEKWTVIVFTEEAESDAAEQIARRPGVTVIGLDRDPREKGDPLWPARFDLKAMNATKGSVGSRSWSALYQQRPAPMEGSLFKRKWFERRWKPTQYEGIIECEGRTFDLKSCLRFSTVDLATSKKTEADYTVIFSWAVSVTNPPFAFLLGVYRGHPGGDEIDTEIARALDRYDGDFAGVESVAFQLNLIQRLQQRGVPVRECRVDADKVARAWAISPVCADGRVVLPAEAVWLEDFFDEILTFPRGVHDDQVDALSALNQFIDQALLGAPDPLPEKKPEDRSPIDDLVPRGNPFRELLGG